MVPPQRSIMEDRELKKLLLETCPVRPGQEERAWAALRERLSAKPAPSGWNVLFQPSWRSGAFAGVVAGLVIGAVVSFVLTSQAQIFVTANSQAPGVYATSFYSKSAGAQRLAQRHGAGHRQQADFPRENRAGGQRA